MSFAGVAQSVERVALMAPVNCNLKVVGSSPTFGYSYTCDILDAQNQVMAKHMIGEAAKNKDFREEVMKMFKKQHNLLSQVATALDIDGADINASKPTKQTPAADKDDEVVKALSEELQEEVKVLTIDYSDSGNRNKVKSKETKTVRDGTLVQDWVAHIEKKMQNRYQAEWQTLTPAQQKRFFFKMGLMLIAEEKEAEPATKPRRQQSKRKATQASGGGSVQGRRGRGGRPGTKSSKSRNNTPSIGMNTLLPRQLSADFREAVNTRIATKAQESELKVMKREQKSHGDDQDAAEEKEDDEEEEEEGEDEVRMRRTQALPFRTRTSSRVRRRSSNVAHRDNVAANEKKGRGTQ
ncbi:unnamed protein product [Zymoseptoria tritici ST99CH_1A5]|uniref:Uncharacterized protein n=1 Tax=Zymoseptoria tritici ST99CH_1A5 TaxID=1276529 RepID=A0A1Y6LKC9_ZYMTR|nr:unnamed protein product [Zymoseptoria tritici ST99CH_1A5]